MIRFVLPCAALTASLIASLPASALQPALTRTFVSSSGVDTNPCTVAAPCATFAQAYSVVAPNGIVAALDPGKYGPLTITRPVTIDGNGWASITAPTNGTGIGILIQAENGDNVILRGITIDGGGGSAVVGIEFNSGASLTLTSCVVRNISGGDGLDFFSNGSSAEILTVADSQFINNDTDGVFIATQSSGSIAASFVRTETSGNRQDGLSVNGSGGTGLLGVAVTDSVTAQNTRYGFTVSSPAGQSPSTLFVANSQAVNNFSGVEVDGSKAMLWLSQSTVASNTFGYRVTAPGVFNTYSNNYLADDAVNLGTPTLVGAQ
jgi:hypothetical protein